MKIKDINLLNYRCFDNIHIDFKSQVNLLIGDNASGKTTIIDAVKSILSSFYCGFSDEYTKFIGLSTNDFRETLTSSGVLAITQPIKVSFNMGDRLGHLELRNRKSRNKRDGLKSITKYSKSIFDGLTKDNRDSQLPLFAYFSTEDIHSSRRESRVSEYGFKKYIQKPSFGYYESLNGGYLFKYWRKRLLVLKEAGYDEEVNEVKLAILEALGKNGCNIITDVHVRVNAKDIYYTLTDGRIVSSVHLSDGYMRLVNIVTDIAFRAIILNKGINGQNACKETEGVVLIDEIDMHLHPELQHNVLNGIKKAFPKLQFIVSSHSPIVIGGLKCDDNNVVKRIAFEDGNYTISDEEKAYGVDASTILKQVMKSLDRNAETNEELVNLFKKIDNDELYDARLILNRLKESYGLNVSELSKAEAMLDFLE